MNIHEWCIAVLKGRVNYTKTSDLYSLCTKHFRERNFDSADELLAALEPFKEYFYFEDFHYDYETLGTGHEVNPNGTLGTGQRFTPKKTDGSCGSSGRFS